MVVILSGLAKVDWSGNRKTVMEGNSIVEGMVILLVVLLVIFLISRNRKDQKKMEQEITKSEIDPEKHGDERI